MKQKNVLTLALGIVILVSPLSGASAEASETKMITQTPKMKMTTPIPEKITTPDKVKTPIGTLEFFDGIPIGRYQRGCL